MSRLIAALAACTALVIGLGGCAGSGDDDMRHMSAEFPSARSFYPESKVKIMGADVGTVEKIENLGDRIRVRFTVRRDVPIARGVNASIMPVNLVGERYLILHPVWRPGMAREQGDAIPLARTHVPVETDEALQAYRELAKALDPAKTRAVTGKAAASIKGTGAEFNAALEQGARLTGYVASQDKELLAVAKDLDRLAGVVRGREQVLGVMIRDFGTATKVLSQEREDLKRLVKGVRSLTDQGDSLVDTYDGKLPADIAVLTRFALTLENNTERIKQLVASQPALQDTYVNAYNPETKSLWIRFATDATLRVWVKDLLNEDDVPCLLPPPNSNCPWQEAGGGS